MPAHINGFSLAYTAVGAVVLWSGIKGETISATFKGLLSGTPPSDNTEQISTAADTTTGTSGTSGSTSTGTAPAGNTGADTTTAAANQAIAKLLAAPYGWSTGTEWTDLVSLWNQESGWSNTADQCLQRRVRHPAGAPRFQDGRRGEPPDLERVSPDFVGPVLYPEHLRQPVGRMGSRSREQLVLTWPPA